MFDKIKKRIAEQTADVVVKTKPADDTALIAEYAHVFQELDDLSIEGTDAGKARSIEILVDNDGRLAVDDDDIELDVIGFNLKTGTLDIPSDAAIKTEYSTMKTHDDFVSESVNLLEREDEDPDTYDARREKWADRQWMRYRQTVLQEGMFGYKRINATAEAVPSLATINFGEYNGSAYNVRMPIQHQVDGKGNLTRKQLESIFLAESCGMCENLMSEVKKDLCERYCIEESASIWDTAIPSVLVAPIDPIDKHAVLIGFKNDANLSGMDFYRFTNPVCEFSTSGATLENASVERIDNDKVRELSKFCITKNAAIKESQKETPRYHRGIIQEGIDLGDADASGSNNESASSTDQNSTPPAMDDEKSDNNADGATQEPSTVNVGTNDVSDDIAKKASEETQDAAPADDANVGDDASTDIPDTNDTPDLQSDDASATDDTTATDGEMPTEADIDTQLQDLNTSGNEEGALSADDVDIEHMSIEALLKQGTDMLKSMSLSQLKEFLANNETAAVQEAFILTNANINDEVDILLKKTLGVLNDNNMEITQLVSEFKKYGKKLNRVLTKASKATKVYNNNEIDNIKKLNKCLADLMVTIKASTDKSSIQVIKRLMKAFTSQAAVVGNIVEKKKKELPKAQVKETKKNVQESYSPSMSSFLDNLK